MFEYRYYTFVPWCTYAFTTAHRDKHIQALKLKAWLAASVLIRQAD